MAESDRRAPANSMEPDLDLDFDLELEPLAANETDFSFFGPLAEDEPSLQDTGAKAAAVTSAAPDVSRAYHSKRPHKKSRAGCKQCKVRKVKCDEGRPACRSCTLRKETCVYPPSAPSVSSVSEKASSVSNRSPRSSRFSTPSLHDAVTNTALVLSEPMFRPEAMNDAVDMKMLWMYTSQTYNSFNIEGAGRIGAIDHVLRVTIPEIAFQTPFLMHTLMGLSALNLRNIGQLVPANKAAAYRAKAFEGYRSAIGAARSEEFPALLAGSLLICALSSEMFREPDTKPLYIVDWMTVWRGIGLIVDMMPPSTIVESGLAVLFYRPPIDLEKSSKCIPNNLLLMLTSIKADDPDYEYQQTYYQVLKYMGSLYQELENGFRPIMDLRVITFFTFIPRDFIPLATAHRPRALIILAHYCAFTKQNRGPWWMLNIGDRQIREISEEIGPEWEHLMRVPLRVMRLTDKTEIAKAILENDTWTTSKEDLFATATRDPRCHLLNLTTDDGRIANIIGGEWSLEPPPKFVEKLQISDPGWVRPLGNISTFQEQQGCSDSPDVQPSPMPSEPPVWPDSKIPVEFAGVKGQPGKLDVLSTAARGPVDVTPNQATGASTKSIPLSGIKGQPWLLDNLSTAARMTPSPSPQPAPDDSPEREPDSWDTSMLRFT